MFKYEELEGKGGNWYQVIDSDNKGYAVFSLMDVPNPAPNYCKHMDINLRSEIAEEVFENGNTTLLLEIYNFVFQSVLEISHESKNVKLCKIYSATEQLALVYTAFADNLSANYDVTYYQRWIEIRKK